MSDLLEYFENVLKKFVNSIAIMIVTTFVLPLFVLMIFKWLLNELFTLNLDVPQVKVTLPGMHRLEKAEVPTLPKKHKVEMVEETLALSEKYEEEQEAPALVEKEVEENTEAPDLPEKEEE